MTRVLVVDDKKENLYYLTALLGPHGYEVETARDGVEALAKARARVPDLIITDLLMPVMDGYTLLRHWKTDPKLRGTPFIVYTATYTDPADEELALRLGADAFILKPTEPADFLRRVHEVRVCTAPFAPRQLAPVEREEDLEHAGVRGYSEILIRKLEQKTLQLEESNRKLRDDVQARERAEATARESETRFRQLAENIEDVFWLSDPDKRSMLYVSPAYEIIWGRPCQSLIDSPASWMDNIHPEDRERVAATLGNQKAGPWEQIYRIRRPDGTQRWIRDRGYPVRDAHGTVYRIAGVSKDITAYRHLEEQFRQVQKMEAVGRLAAGVAHDFNNLLSVILSYTALVLDDLPRVDRSRDDIEQVHRAGQRAVELTRQLLAFSRQQALQPKVFALREVLGEMEKMLSRLLGADIDLSLRIGAAGKIYADASQIEQVLMNLAVNARDAMPRGGKLTVELEEIELDAKTLAVRPGLEPGPYVRLVVADTGTGMNAETRERIFEPFFTTKEKGSGTGLGLATVFGIIEQSQGHIDVHSELGVGTTFRILLPCTRRSSDPPEAAPVSVRTSRGTETILVVEDDEQVRTAASAILRRHGYTVLDAANGGEAYLLSERHEGAIDLLITDVVMPRMSGRELADHLRTRRPELKVLFMSGYSEHVVVHHDVLGPGVAFLSKPFVPDALLRKTRETIEA